MQERTAELRELADKQAIENAVSTHNRGIDRADYALMTSIYADDATVDFGFFAGPAHDFARMIIDGQLVSPVCLHRTCQNWIKVAGDAAKVESYIHAVIHAPDSAGTLSIYMVPGRYLDRFARIDGAWKMTHRQYVLEGSSIMPRLDDFGEPSADPFLRGGLGNADIGRALLRNHELGIRNPDGEVRMTQDAVDIDALLSKQAVKELTFAVARGVDRADEATFRSAFHPDAQISFGMLNGSLDEVAPALMSHVRGGLKASQHAVSNQWFDIRGDQAVGESYVLAFALFDDIDGKEQELRFAGRYIDRFERRDGVWKISSRTVIKDASGVLPSTNNYGGMFEPMKMHGGFAPDDPIYEFWDR